MVDAAYEPVWAIGTGKTATPAIAADAHLMIRSEVAARLVGGHVLQMPCESSIGGSVNQRRPRTAEQAAD